MNSNTHHGGSNPLPVVMGGGLLNATLVVPHTFRAQPAPLWAGVKRAAVFSWAAAHPFFGGQGCVRALHARDVAEAAPFPTAGSVAVPIRGVAAAIR